MHMTLVKADIEKSFYCEQCKTWQYHCDKEGRYCKKCNETVKKIREHNQHRRRCNRGLSKDITSIWQFASSLWNAKAEHNNYGGFFSHGYKKIFIHLSNYVDNEGFDFKSKQHYKYFINALSHELIHMWLAVEISKDASHCLDHRIIRMIYDFDGVLGYSVSHEMKYYNSLDIK